MPTNFLTVTGLDCGSVSRPFPNPVNNGAIFIEGGFITETNSGIGNPYRGKLPGYATILANYQYFPNDLSFTIHTATDGSNRRYFHIYSIMNSSAAVLMFVLSLDNWRA